jgi:hypothetical protein
VTRALVLVVLVSTVACDGDRRKPPPQPSEPGRPPVSGPTPTSPPGTSVETPPWAARGSTAEDPNQLTPEEQARLDQMIEGTSAVPACNELVRLIRKAAACPTIARDLRPTMLRAALAIADMTAAGSNAAPELTSQCGELVKQFENTLSGFGC